MPQAARFKLQGNCVNCGEENVPLLEAMQEEGEEIGYKAFVAAVDPEDLEELTESLGYKRMGLKLKDDWHVSYHRSRWGDKPCVYMTHSMIEYWFYEGGSE